MTEAIPEALEAESVQPEEPTAAPEPTTADVIAAVAELSTALTSIVERLDKVLTSINRPRVGAASTPAEPAHTLADL